MTTPVAVEVPPSVRLEFGHAALQMIAAETDIDLLHIKGVATDTSIRHVVGSGSDADVLVRPRQVAQFLAHLERHGWQRYSDFQSGSPFGHAATYVHASWGFGDVHRHFPGIALPPDEAFERLWSARQTRALAGVDCAVPSLSGQLTILVLNAARSGGSADRMAMVRTCWEASPAGLRAEVTDFVAALRAEVAFSAGLGRLDRYRGRREYLLWKVSSEGGTRLEEWFARVYATPTVREALRLAVRAPLVNTKHLALRLGRQPTRTEVLREFVARPHRGVRQELGRLRARGDGRHTRRS